MSHIWKSHMWLDSFIRVLDICILLQHTATHYNIIVHPLHIHVVWHDSILYVPRSIYICAMNHWYMCHDSFTYMMWLIHICDVNYSCIWYDSLTCIFVTWPIYARDMTHSYMCHDQVICVNMCEMTHSWMCLGLLPMKTCRVLQCVVVCCSVLQHVAASLPTNQATTQVSMLKHCQHTATRCNTLQHTANTATHCNTLQHTGVNVSTRPRQPLTPPTPHPLAHTPLHKSLLPRTRLPTLRCQCHFSW